MFPNLDDKYLEKFIIIYNSSILLNYRYRLIVGRVSKVNKNCHMIIENIFNIFNNKSYFFE